MRHHEYPYEVEYVHVHLHLLVLLQQCKNVVQLDDPARWLLLLLLESLDHDLHAQEKNSIAPEHLHVQNKHDSELGRVHNLVTLHHVDHRKWSQDHPHRQKHSRKYQIVNHVQWSPFHAFDLEDCPQYQEWIRALSHHKQYYNPNESEALTDIFEATLTRFDVEVTHRNHI